MGNTKSSAVQLMFRTSCTNVSVFVRELDIFVRVPFDLFTYFLLHAFGTMEFSSRAFRIQFVESRMFMAPIDSCETVSRAWQSRGNLFLPHICLGPSSFQFF